MPPEQVTLPREVRAYFSAIGKRGGASGRRELTRQQAKLLVAIREAKRAAKKASKPPAAFTARQLARSEKPSRYGVNADQCFRGFVIDPGTSRTYRKPLTMLHRMAQRTWRTQLMDLQFVKKEAVRGNTGSPRIYRKPLTML